jgi:hypothetical protein
LTAWILPLTGRGFYGWAFDLVYEWCDRPTRIDLEFRILRSCERDAVDRLDGLGWDEPSAAVADEDEQVIDA